VRHNLRFVVSIAKKYTASGAPLADLIGDGNFGLIRASKDFDPERGVKFISYAVHWIRQSILAGLATSSRVVRVPPRTGATPERHRGKSSKRGARVRRVMREAPG